MANHTQPDSFVHLHVHSQYSLLDGACRTADLPRRAKELGQSAIAITDHGAMFGIVDFYTRCVAEGVKPIIGIEAYMAPGDRRDRTHTGVKDGGYHLLLLAQNRTGYQNLLKLASTAYLDGFYYKPRIDKQALADHAEGLIATSACLGGEIPAALTRDDRKRAQQLAELYIKTFGPDRFFIELQSHIPEQARVNPELIDLADRLGVGTVATNDVHFLLADDHAPHDALCCISTGKLISDESRLRYPTQLYLKDAAEMRAAAPDLADKWREACDNTVRIAEMCDAQLDFNANHAPVVKIEKRNTTPDAEPGEPSGSAPESTSLAPAPGSTERFTAFCARYELLPFDSGNDTESEHDLKRQCDEALRELVEAGAIWRYGEGGITPDIRQRIDRELQVLADKLISAYFLMVWDFVNYARARGIPCMARGSGVGTMVGYCLGLSNACPVKYGLLFERFTDPDRSEYPDIDIDICQNGRAEVIDYVRRKYGHVAQIITFGTLKARAVIRDVGRVMDIPLPEVDRIAKLVPADLGMTLEKALDAEAELRQQYQQDPQTRKLIDIGRRLEGLARHASVHAAGVVVATQPLHNIIPLYKDPRAGKTNGNGNGSAAPDQATEVITQWDGPTCENVGLLKMDFLGLRTLSVVERAKGLVRATLDRDTQVRAIAGDFGAGPRPDTPREFGLPTWHGHPARDPAHEGLSNQKSKIKNQKSIDPLDLERLAFVDQNVLDLFRRGETSGVFQFESGGMRSLLIGMQPDRLEDLIAANALFRPGPMDLIPDYNDRKNGRATIPRTHPIVDRFTAETYGVMIYQEQVMQIIHELGDIPLREAYTIIKAISKKKHKVIDAARGQFIAGAGHKGLAAPQAEDLFELILKFAGYGFNKSHSTGYAIVAYQTAYLKTYFPVQYMAALLTFESVSTDKVTEYIEESRRVRFPGGRVGIEVRPPDINLSYADFTVVFEDGEPRDPNHGHIRFGLGAVKGVGAKAIDTIIAARDKGGPFRGLHDFCERVPQGLVNKAVIEALVKCGAFDSLHGVDKRAALIEAVETAMSRGAQEASLSSSDDFLFGEVAGGGGGGGGEGGPRPVGSQLSDGGSDQPALPNVEPWSPAETLKQEKSVLGFFVSSHPLDEHRPAIERFGTAAVSQARRMRADTEVIVGGMISRVRQTLTRAKQEKMAILTLEDVTGSMDAVAFPRTYADHAHLLTAERIVMMTGKIDRRREEPNLIIDQVIPIAEAPERLTRAVRITLRDGDGRSEPSDSARPPQPNGELSSLRGMLRQSPGAARVLFELHAAGRIVILECDKYRVHPDPQLPARINAILQHDACELIGPMNVLEQSPERLLDDGEPAVMNRLAKQATGGEVCESVDRY